MKEAINKYYLDAKIKYNNELYDVKRIIGNGDSSIYINGEVKELTEYREFFGIKRKDYDKQVILTAKSSLVSLRQNPTFSDYETILDMLKLDQLIKNIKDIYITQDDIKRLKQNKKDLISTFEDSLKKNNETIEQRIYLIDKREEELSKEIAIMAERIKTLEISNYKKSSITEYENINIKFKQLRHTIDQMRIEKIRLSNYMKEVDNSEVTNAQLLSLYEKAKVEIPSMVVRQLSDVEKFHQSVIKDRKETIIKRTSELELTIDDYNEEAEL